MTLREKQTEFAFAVAGLLCEARSRGYAVTLGECYRSNEQAELNAIGLAGRARVAGLVRQLFPLLADAIKDNGNAGGIRNSLHGSRLAVDLNLFRNGVFLQRTEDYRELGEWWETQHELARWGGRFGDGNHFSFAHNGRK